MISKEAKEISKIFGVLRDYGYLVYNFNTQSGMKSGSQKGLCDHLLIGSGGIHFIEVKLKSTKDKMRKSQEPLELIAERLSTLSPYVWYFIISSSQEAKELVNTIIKTRS